MRGERAVHAHAVPGELRRVRAGRAAELPRAARVREAGEERHVRRREAEELHVRRVPDQLRGGGRAVQGGQCAAAAGRARRNVNTLFGFLEFNRLVPSGTNFGTGTNQGVSRPLYKL